MFGGDLFLSQTVEESADMVSKSDEILELKAVAVASLASFICDDDAVDIGSPNHNSTTTGVEMGTHTESEMPKVNVITSFPEQKEFHKKSANSSGVNYLDSVELTPMIFSPSSLNNSKDQTGKIDSK